MFLRFNYAILQMFIEDLPEGRSFLILKVSAFLFQKGRKGAFFICPGLTTCIFFVRKSKDREQKPAYGHAYRIRKVSGRERRLKMNFGNDNFTNRFIDENQTEAFLTDMCSKDKWFRVATSDLLSKSMTDSPLSVQDERMSKNFIGVTDDAILDTMQNSALVLSYPDKARYERPDALLRDTAVAGLLDRAGIRGSALKRVKKKNPANYVMLVNTCLDVWSNQALLLERGGKISAIHGGDNKDYAVLPQDELFNVLKTTMAKESASFVDAYIDHTVTLAEYQLPKGSLSKCEQTMADHGYPLDPNWFPRLKFYTSDTSNSSVTLSAQIQNGSSMIPVGNPIRLNHRNGATVADFEKKFDKLFAMFKDGFNRMVELVNCPVFAPAKMAEQLAKANNLPLRPLATVIAERMLKGEMTGTATAFDVYVVLADSVAAYRKATGSTQMALVMEETLARILFSDIDIWNSEFDEINGTVAAAQSVA